jgi:hypothetical protein
MTGIIHHQIWGYKVEENLHLWAREQERSTELGSLDASAVHDRNSLTFAVLDANS